MGFADLDPIGPLGRTNSTPNVDTQADDHNVFADRLDALRTAGEAVETQVGDLDTAVAGKLAAGEPWTSLREAFAGVTVPARSLYRIRSYPSRIKRVVVCGDSQSQGNYASTPPTHWQGGGPGSWPEQLSVGLQGVLGPCLSRGFRGMWTGEWSVSVIGSWTYPTTASTWDVAPWGQALTHTAQAASTEYLTWTKPTTPILNTCVGFVVWWIDRAAGSGDWTYQINSTGGWYAMGQTRVGDDRLKCFYVPSGAPVTSVRFRATNQGGTGAACTIVGITPYALDPRSALNGFVLDNLGFSAKTLYEFRRDDSVADPWSILDGFVPSTSDLPGTPDLVICGFSNDANSAIVPTGGGTVGGNTTLWEDNITALHSRVHPYADYLHWASYDRAFYDDTNEGLYRASVHSRGDALGFAVLDMYEAWGHSLGAYGWNAANAAGFMDTGTSGYAHAGPYGHADQAGRVRRIIETLA